MENMVVGALGVIVCLILLGSLYGLAAVMLAGVGVFAGFMFILGLTTRMDEPS